jgi:hypothetical protein
LADVTLEGELLANQSDQLKEDEMGGACGRHGRDTNAYRILVGRPEGNYQLEDIGVDRRVLLKWLFNTHYGRLRTALIWMKRGTMVRNMAVNLWVP